MFLESHLPKVLSSVSWLDHACLIIVVTSTATVCVVRRRTWSIPFENRITFTGVLLAVGIVLTSPQAIALNPTLPNGIVAGTKDEWCPQIVWGNWFILLGLTIFCYDLACRMAWSDRRRGFFLESRIAIPLTVTAPVSAAAWIFHEYPVTGLLIILGYMWLISHTLWMVWKIRTTDPRANIVTDIYLAALLCAILAISLRAFWYPLGLPQNSGWNALCVAATLFMAAAIASWVRKQRWLKAGAWKRVQARKPAESAQAAPEASRELEPPAAPEAVH